MASICNPPTEHEVIEISSGSEEDSEEDSSEESGTSGSSDEDGNLSEGDELRHDLEKALQSDNLNFHGSYSFATVLPSFPLPCLSIKGLGIVGLPLSEADAKRIIEAASQAPYGRGNLTIVNKEVRDTWEIDQARVQFENPAWNAFVQNLAIQTVCDGLGVTNYDTPPRCDFYKLLLYETGSRFLPHTDTQKADGMFATMIILLPSKYTGGEVHLRRGSESEIVDFSSSSFTNSAVLAWYTDVVHEVKPVTSGYRLALSYNLIHTSRCTPWPIAPSLDNPLSQLKRILQKWNMAEYNDGDSNCKAYLLQHQYCPAELQKGEACLRGEDVHRVSFLRAAADELGYLICLATLEYRITGSSADDYGYSHGYSKRRRATDYAHSLEGSSTTISLDNTIDLSGNLIFNTTKSIDIGDEDMIPKDAFKDQEPDDVEEEYTGNEGTTIDYWYQRSAFAIIPQRKLLDVLGGGGIKYKMNWLRRSLSANSPTAEERDTAITIIRNVRSVGKEKDRRSVITTMVEYAFKWRDLEMWKEVVSNGWRDMDLQGEHGLTIAWHVFGFNSVRPGFEEFLSRQSLPDRLKDIDDICQSAHWQSDDDANLRQWHSNQTTAALESYTQADREHVPLIVSMARQGGIQSIQNLPVSKMESDGGFNFLTALVPALLENRDAILSQTLVDGNDIANGEAQIQPTSLLDDYIKHCLHTMMKQWNANVAGPGRSLSANQSRLNRIIRVVQLCILTGQMKLCQCFLTFVWNAPEDPFVKFDSLYSPLAPRLVELLQKTKTDICSPPFSDFLRNLISQYLQYVLGTKQHNPRPALPKLGCGCKDCELFDQFMARTELQYGFQAAERRRRHLSSQIERASHLVTHETRHSGSPHTLLVTKTLFALAATSWDCRLGVIKRFLKAIGTKNIENIMGSRYADVSAALNGTRAYKSSGQGSSDATAAPSNSVVPAIAGEKRKQM